MLGLTKIMKPPIILDEHGDVSFYPNAESAALAMEPIDVRNNEYIAYDSAGYILKLVPGTANVTIAGHLSTKPEINMLVESLRSFWQRASGKPVPSNASTLDQLLQLCVREFGYSR